MEMKICTKCGVEYPATSDYFYKSKASKSGLKSHCKICAKEMNKINHARHYENNKEKVNKKNMENYYKKNPREVIPDGMKRCSKCKEVLPVEKFSYSSKSRDGLRYRCKECRKTEYTDSQEYYLKKRKIYYKQNKHKVLKMTKEYKQRNLEWYQSYNKKYYEENADRMKENSKRSLYRRIEEDIGFKILQRLRKRMYEAVKGNVKSARTQRLIGCSVEQLQEHLEKQFTEGMSFDNYGEWHVDHIIPCSSFDFTKEEQQRECFNYMNLQPLWAIDNLRKSNKIIASE